MAILSPILAIAGRAAGRLLNTVFGWATVMLFGRVPESRQMYLSVIALGSVVWLIVLLGIAFPAFGAFVLAFVPIPPWVDPLWVRMAMLAAAVLIPLMVGAISVLMLAPEERPQGIAAKAWVVLKGYPYTLGLALALIMMIVFVPIMKLRPLLRRWDSQHMPVIVEADDYLEVVREIQRALEQRGWRIERHRANWMLRLPTRVLTLFASGAIDDLVADQLTVLRSDSLEVVLHPSDLAISSKKEEVARARADIAEQLAFSKAHLTWSKEANEIEDQLNALWRQMKALRRGISQGEAAEKLQSIELDLRDLKVPYEEWEVLFRTKLLVERGLLHVVAGITERPRDVTDAHDGQTGAELVLKGPPRQPDSAPRLAAFTALGTAAASAFLTWLALRRQRATTSQQHTMPLLEDALLMQSNNASRSRPS